jgi:hypothetical protein
LPNGEFCDGDHRACRSGVCDPFDLICCNRLCFDDEFCNEIGQCESFSPPTPTPVRTPSATATARPTETSTPAACPGDCNESGEVLVDEVISGVALQLERPAKPCRAADTNGDGHVTVDEVVMIVEAALRGCASALR